jgi:hypothetical protein
LINFQVSWQKHRYPSSVFKDNFTLYQEINKDMKGKWNYHGIPYEHLSGTQNDSTKSKYIWYVVRTFVNAPTQHNNKQTNKQKP